MQGFRTRLSAVAAAMLVGLFATGALGADDGPKPKKPPVDVEKVLAEAAKAEKDGKFDEARAVIERRAGAAYDPALATLAVQNFADILAGLDETRMWECALECEPSPPICIAGDRIDAAVAAIAAITGLKSP